MTGKQRTSIPHQYSAEQVKKFERQRMEKDVQGTVRSWLLEQPLTAHDPHASIRYIHDFVQALSHLDLYRDGLYLDFGAGSSWIAEWMNELGFTTIATDISLDMLTIARERRGDKAYNSLLVVADGEALPFKSDVFDGTVCVNAFHHLPQPREALKELHRILKITGSSVFFEPGEGHSTDPRSIHDMEHLGVLELDVTIEDMRKMAQEVGFGRGVAITYAFPLPELSFEQWPAFKKEYLHGEFDEGNAQSSGPGILAAFAEHTRRHPLIKLMKAPIPHSRKPGQLAAHIATSTTTIEASMGHRFRIDVTLQNCGDTLWLAETPGGFGMVRVGVHLADEKGEMLDYEFGRQTLSHHVTPGQELSVPLFLKAPEQAGNFTVIIDLVAEGVDWFEKRGSKTVTCSLRVLPEKHEQQFNSALPDTMSGKIIAFSSGGGEYAPGESLVLVCRTCNTGNSTWLVRPPGEEGSVTLGYHLKKENLLFQTVSFAAALFQEVIPGEEYSWLLYVTLPSQAGKYVLEPFIELERYRKIALQAPPQHVTFRVTSDNNPLKTDNITLLTMQNQITDPLFYHLKASHYFSQNRKEEAAEAWALAAHLLPDVALFQNNCALSTRGKKKCFMAEQFNISLEERHFCEQVEPLVKFGDLFKLHFLHLGKDTVQQGEELPLRLTWTGLEPLVDDYTIFFHCYHKKVAHSNVVVRYFIRRLKKRFFQLDLKLGLKAWPTSHWVPGSPVHIPISLPVPRTIVPGEYTLEIGLWIAGNKGSRLKAESAEKTGDTTSLIGTFTVRSENSDISHEQ